jgi:hypothetical protein
MQKSLEKNGIKKPQKSDWECPEKYYASSGAYVDHI